MTGEPGGRPMRAVASVVDYGTGLYGVIGVLLALWRRARTGRGGRSESGSFESATHWANYLTIHAQRVVDHPPLGSSHPAFGLYDVFEVAANEWLFVGVVTEHQ